MGERVLPIPSLADQLSGLLQRPLSRRQFTNRALRSVLLHKAGLATALTADVGAVATVMNQDQINRYRNKLFPPNEFPDDKNALSQEEISQELGEPNHHEEEIIFDEETLGEDSFFVGQTQGSDSDVYLYLPGIHRTTESRLSVFDIRVDEGTDESRLIRTGIISSANPKSKRVLLGELDSSSLHTITINQVYSAEHTVISPDEMVPQLFYSTTPNSLRSLVNRVSAFTQPRPDEPTWNDCIVKKIAIPYKEGSNYRIKQRKTTTAEDSRYVTLYNDWHRTYDDDWETIVIVAPQGQIVRVYDQERWHLKKPYDSNLFMFGTHPMVQTYTSNGMVEPTWYYDPDTPYFADEPEIVADTIYRAMRESRVVDENIQEVSFYEIQELEGQEPDKVENLIIDFNVKKALNKVNPWLPE